MPRKPRRESLTGFYHITGRGINKVAIFNENREKSRVLNLIQDHFQEYNIKIYAYCIMPNHYHLLLQANLKDLASFMAIFLAGFAHYYNYKHNRTGYVFQGRYRSQCIDTKAHFWNCLRYIHLNPVKAHLCKE